MTCTIPDCAEPSHGRGWCKRHYTRWVRHGDPLALQGPRPNLDRFMERVEKAADGCWLWTGPIHRYGYALFARGRVGDVPRKTVRAHRWIYEELVGPIPEGLMLDHLCRVRHCVNPAHMEPVTNRENILRGDTLPAENVRKTECPQGHPYDEANTYVTPRGGRQCRTCINSRRAANYSKARATRECATCGGRGKGQPRHPVGHRFSGQWLCTACSERFERATEALAHQEEHGDACFDCDGSSRVAWLRVSDES